MRLLDLHCDTFTKVEKIASVSLKENPFQVDLNRLKKINAIGQFFAIYRDAKDGYSKELYNNILQSIYCFREEIELNKDIIGLVTRYADLQENIRNNRLSAILAIEDGGLVDQNLDEVFQLGVRLITLTWNHKNNIGYPTLFKRKGLSDFGLQFIDRMQRLGIIIDVSHLSDQGFWDVSNHVDVPFVASHSNARSVHKHRRNLTDNMIKEIGRCGGVIGINYYYQFVGNFETVRIKDIITHIRHIINIAGNDSIALGSDYDGIGNVTEFGDISGIPIFIHALKKEGFTEKTIDKFLSGNIIRVMKDVLK